MPKPFHIPDVEWPSGASEAVAIQTHLRGQVSLKNEFEKLDLVAGIDCSYDIQKDISRAVIVLMYTSDLKLLQSVTAHAPTTFPYVPGLLSFREIPVILKALSQLETQPDFLMVDGQGIAHPRRLGIAAHLGVLMNMPSVGVAKSRLCGSYKEPGLKKGDRAPLSNKKEIIGTVLRSKEKTNPLFISPGHRMNIETAVDITLKCLTKYRLPEPTRIADKISKERDESGRLSV